MDDNTDKLIKQLKRHEGLVTHCYQDHLGYNTIGYGRLIEKGMGGITEAEADYLLMNDLAKFM
ncbi:MAG: glycoside hydrolase family protein, partial [Candidatus Puniceispirillaceae bacterium]